MDLSVVFIRSVMNPVFTGTNYLWLVTQSVISNTMEAPREFPVGMLGKWELL
jgi:hypothetical protein